ncbi:MAG: aminodeoxychorismate/anthranilate synthase component II [Lachnospiraceae bacterium]|nr:aminodeoxychorismate/anthranilate synthase component II [Lachnospiraceae bacterium]
MILLIDNYDSFSYNLVQYIGTIQKSKSKSNIEGYETDYLKQHDIKVARNDELSVKEIEDMSPEYIILSPGPGRPDRAGICEELLRDYTGDAKILGVCLGHQAIVEAFGGKVTYAKELMHGKQSVVTLDKNASVFAGIPENVKVARYHSLAGDKDSLPECLKVIASTEDGEIMAVKHVDRPIYGFQFHPESVLTEYGMEMLNNFFIKE